METVTWTDDKLDVLDGKVDKLTTRVDVLDGKVDTLTTRVDVLDEKVDTLTTRVDVLDVKVDERFKAVGERFDEVNRQLGDLRDGQKQMGDQFVAMQRTLVQVGFSMVVGLIGGLLALIAAVLITH